MEGHPTCREVLNCSIPSWYPNFVNRTVKSITIPLPGTFIENLLADGIIVPNGWSTNSGSEADDWSTVDAEVIDPEREHSENLEYPSLHNDITEGIKKLGGKVFPKLNWSSPRDATWMPCGCTLMCQNPEDIYLLLKSSDFVTHDLTDPFEGCEAPLPPVQYELVLRRWTEINPACEYRCFVRNRRLLAISQRHAHECSPHTSVDEHLVRERVGALFTESIQDKFPLQDYAFDVYLTEQRMVLLDFSPWSTLTDSFLISWDELCELKSDDEDFKPVFRHVSHPKAVRPDPLRGYSLPVDVSLMASKDSDVMVEFLQARLSRERLQDQSSEEES